jgi:hypothetical protein
MTGERLPEELATALAGMARDLLAQDSLQETLDRIVSYALDLVDGCEGAGIMVVTKGTAHTLAASDEDARTSDRVQESSARARASTPRVPVRSPIASPT